MHLKNLLMNCNSLFIIGTTNFELAFENLFINGIINDYIFEIIRLHDIRLTVALYIKTNLFSGTEISNAFDN